MSRGSAPPVPKVFGTYMAGPLARSRFRLGGPGNRTRLSFCRTLHCSRNPGPAHQRPTLRSFQRKTRHGGPEDPDSAEGIRSSSDRPLGQRDRRDGQADRRASARPDPAADQARTLHHSYVAARRQGRARPVRNPHAQARARHRRSQRQDRGRADEARTRGWRRRPDQADLRHTTMTKKYSLGIVGRKAGMSRLFTEDGKSVPVTLIEATPNRITQVKTVETDGYSAVQVAVGTKRAALVNKPAAGHLAKAKVEAGRGLWELRVEADKIGDFAIGGEIKADIFEVGQIVDVEGITKGKGFQGTIKRWNFKMGDATHGNSLSHRAPGSIGQRQTPGRVFPGKRMSGHMGVRRRTVENLQVVQIDVERNLLLVSGAVPGAEGGSVFVKPSVKAAAQARRVRVAPAKK